MFALSNFEFLFYDLYINSMIINDIVKGHQSMLLPFDYFVKYRESVCDIIYIMSNVLSHVSKKSSVLLLIAANIVPIVGTILAGKYFILCCYIGLKARLLVFIHSARC